MNTFILQVEEGTAKVGKDFTHSSASLVQFDPGGYRVKLQLFTFTFSNLVITFLSLEYAESVLYVCV